MSLEMKKPPADSDGGPSKHAEQFNASTHSNSTLVQEYIEAELYPIPILPGKKGQSFTGWNKEGAGKKYSNSFGRYALEAGNIGLHHGDSRTCAIDIDDLEQARKDLKAKADIDLDAFLNAPDAVQIHSGRKNRAKLLYRWPAGAASYPTHQYKGADGEMILEFRCMTKGGDSNQDMLPPSTHPGGTTYAWGGSGHFSKLPTLPDEFIELEKNWEQIFNDKPNLVGGSP